MLALALTLMLALMPCVAFARCMRVKCEWAFRNTLLMDGCFGWEKNSSYFSHSQYFDVTVGQLAACHLTDHIFSACVI